MSDKHFSNVVLLVGFEGADGSTSFIDESPSGHTLTAIGNAQVDTAQSRFGGSSGLFDGNGDYISIPDSHDFSFGAGDFTIETFVRFNVVQTSMFISKYNNSITPAEWFFGYNGNLIFLGFFGNGGSDFISVTGAVTPVANTWYHAAVARSGNTFRVFWQGAQVGSLSSAVTLKNTTESVRIGSRNHGNPSYLSGWLDELRVTKGVARYPAPFVPPQGPFSRYKGLGVARAARFATLPGLFGTMPDDVKLAVGRFSGKGRFADLARNFFSRLTFRCLDYYLSRELSNHVGPERRFRSIREHTEFDSALDLHCRETSRILKEYAAEWFSKKNFEKALTPDEAGRFASIAFGKIRKELRKRRDADG